MTARFFYVIAAVLVFMQSCDKKDKESPAEPDPKAALQLANFKTQSFAELDLEDKCEGIKNFFVDFQRNHLPDVELTFNPKSCTHSQINDKHRLFDVRPIFKKDEAKLEMGVILTFSFDRVSATLSPNQPNFSSYKDQNWILFEPETYVEFFGPNFLTLENTFIKWLNVREKHDVRVYGLSFFDFLIAVENRFGPESDGMTLINPAVKFRIVPDPKKKGEGTVDFIEADLVRYTKTSESGEVVREKFLNCLDLECLRSTKIIYDITSHLNLYSEATASTENPEWLRQDFFSIPLFFVASD